ncbi:M15 family metallopeptidase [bacterium]|nr:M15 family metallopeptidase [bacterium]
MCAAENLSARHSGYRFRIFDAYRPLAVQEFMVIHTAQEFCWKVHHIFLNEAVEEVYTEAMDHALKLFAKPNPSPEAPPPHSTGSAIDLTIVNAE